MKTNYKYFNIKLEHTTPMPFYSCVTKSGITLGWIEWFGEWNQYCFFPHNDVLFSKSCLLDITDFLEQVNQEECRRTAQINMATME